MRLTQLLKQYSNQKAVFLEFCMRIIAKKIDKRMVSTSEFLAEKRVDFNQRINFELFCNLMPELIRVDSRECAQLFKEIDKKEEGSSRPA